MPENFEKDIKNNTDKTAESAALIKSARNEILRLREFSRSAIAEGKTQNEYDILQYAPDFENMDPGSFGEAEAVLLDMVMNSAGEDTYSEFVNLAKKYQQERIFILPKESPERKPLAAFFNYIANRGSQILSRGQD